jgi:beta-lactamase superfamily II metal-dependent hydrolase
MFARAETLPPWSPGVLEIHQISTGRGNSALFVLPDGTTLLVDAGAAGNGIEQTEPHPDATRTPGAWIARYLQRHLPAGSAGLDYTLITHFHVDHMGGIADVAKAVPVRKLLDRGWPEYSYPVPLADAEYLKFARARLTERVMAGSAAQIRLVHDAAKYPDFEIRNIVVNGEMWIGSGSGTRRIFPALDGLAREDLPNENMCGAAIRIRYGRFGYFTGGDLPGSADPGFPAWHAVEEAIAPVVGRVDVHVVNQHGSMGEESEAFLRALQSKVLIIPSWAPSHPAPDVLKRIMNSRLAPSPRFVFATDLRDAAKIVIGQRATQLAGPAGHIVVRVEAGGAKYSVYVLDHRDEHDTVLTVKGPFPSD